MGTYGISRTLFTTEIWREGNGRVSFRALVSARDTVVINHGYAEYE